MFLCSLLRGILCTRWIVLLRRIQSWVGSRLPGRGKQCLDFQSCRIIGPRKQRIHSKRRKQSNTKASTKKHEMLIGNSFKFTVKKCDFRHFIYCLKNLLSRAHYDPIDIRDVALSRSLNSEYLSQIFIKTDTSKMDGKLVLLRFYDCLSSWLCG